jgi:GNAT superfamily N-acetyltransferase
MPTTCLPVPPILGLHTVELTPDRAPELQRFFEDNPAYFLATSGEPAGPDEAYEEITGEVPPGWEFTKKWVFGYVNEHGSMVAMANVITDLLAPSVWHIGTFILATARHATGDAQTLYRGVERWAADNGAVWMRLGVVLGNTRAERFWRSQGYIAVRLRDGIQMGGRTNTVQNMVKPLADSTLEPYFTLVPRDRPEGRSPP